MGSGYNKRRATGEQKVLRAIRLDDQEDVNNSEDRVTLKVWNMMTPESRIYMPSAEEVRIGLVKDSTAKTGRTGGKKMYQQNKKSWDKFLQISQAEGK